MRILLLSFILLLTAMAWMSAVFFSCYLATRAHEKITMDNVDNLIFCLGCWIGALSGTLTLIKKTIED